ncbi:hypothetical protein ACO0R3_001594 [Hanseniaspora guilliermondii]
MSKVSASNNLQALKDAIGNNKSISLMITPEESTNDITKASTVKINDNDYLIDEATNFTKNNLSLRVVYHCWLNKDTSAADYLNDCKTKNIQNVAFLIRNDLIAWLSGSKDDSRYIEEERQTLLKKTSSTTGNLHEQEQADGNVDMENELNANDSANDDFDMDGLNKDSKHVGVNERSLTDHNSLMRGSKLVDFNFLVDQTEQLVKDLTKEISILASQEQIQDKKITQSNGINKNITQNVAKSSIGKGKDPVILIPSSASSVITMANVREFLLNGQFISSSDVVDLDNDIIKISKKFDVTKQNEQSNVVVGQTLRFNVVNNTRLFSKPEYWDRVVAIIVSGQEWQFQDYKWSNPDELFKHCNGVYFGLSDKNMPENIEKWNVHRYFLDKNKAYKNIEASNLFWDNVKKVCIGKGIIKE